MNKNIFFLFVLVSIIAVFSIFVSAETLTLWLPPYGSEEVLDQKIWEPVIKEFEEENNVKVNLQIVPWSNYEEKYMTGIASGEGPDVGYMYAEMFPDFINMGALSPIKDYLTQEDYDNYMYLDKGIMFGKQYGLPIIVGNAAILYYNSDILNKLGVKPPTNWEEFREICIKATQDTDGDGKIDQWGYVPGWGASYFGEMNYIWYCWLWQAGGDLYSPDLTKVAFNSAEGIKAAKFLYDLKFKDKVIPDIITSQNNQEMFTNFFAKGKAAFMIYQSVAASKILEKEYPNLNWGFVPSLKDKEKGTFVAADQLVLLSSAKNKELSFKLMRHLTSSKGMTRFHEFNPWPPIAKDEEYNGNSMFKDLYTKDVDSLRALRPAPKGSGIYDYLYKQLQLMMMGNKSPEDALYAAELYSNMILKQ